MNIFLLSCNNYFLSSTEKYIYPYNHKHIIALAVSNFRSCIHKTRLVKELIISIISELLKQYELLISDEWIMNAIHFNEE